MSKMVDSPSDWLGPVPTGKAPAGAKVNGEDGYQKRTSSPNAVDEVMRDPTTAKQPTSD